MSNTPNLTNPTTWALDREIVLVRVLDATRDAVFAAWTDAEAFCQWFGPDGYACTCLLYTSDAADERTCVDLGGRRIIKKKQKKKYNIMTTN